VGVLEVRRGRGATQGGSLLLLLLLLLVLKVEPFAGSDSGDCGDALRILNVYSDLLKREMKPKKEEK
jgi:hypothetical protein